MSALQNLENQLNDVFTKNAPRLPDKARKAIVEYLPWINLALGVLVLWSVYNLWQWANVANSLADYANSLSAVYGGPAVEVERLTIMLWVSLAVLALQAVLYLVAFPALRARKKSGWNLMFYALLVNVVYGVVTLFSNYGGLGNLVTTLIASAVGLYFLFQIRSSYSASRASKHV